MRTLKIHSLNSVKEQPWIDKDYLLFHSCFQILVDFVEKENGLHYWRFETDQTPMNDLESLYEWWKENSETIDCIEDLAQEKLEQLIKYRRFLWT